VVFQYFGQIMRFGNPTEADLADMNTVARCILSEHRCWHDGGERRRCCQQCGTTCRLLDECPPIQLFVSFIHDILVFQSFVYKMCQRSRTSSSGVVAYALL